MLDVRWQGGVGAVWVDVWMCDAMCVLFVGTKCLLFLDSVFNFPIESHVSPKILTPFSFFLFSVSVEVLGVGDVFRRQR